MNQTPVADAQLIDKSHATLRWIAVAMLLFVPLIVLVICSVLEAPAEPDAGAELMLYILLVLAVVDPLFALFLERFLLGSASGAKRAGMGAVQMVQQVGIIKLAFVEATYIYALVVYLVLGDFTAALYFYPIGIAWSAVMWPRRERFEQQVRKLEAQ